MDPMMASIMLFAGNFAPRGWAFCDGQLLPISQNSALFSLLGTTYGGDGRTTFALPDLRGRAPIGPRTGPGLSTRKLGQRSGVETTTINVLNLPNHNHVATFTQTSGAVSIGAVADTANSDDPTNRSLATPDVGGNNFIYSDDDPSTNLKPGAVQVTGTVQVGLTGGQQPFNNMQPFLGVNYIIAMQGIFPSRN